MSEYVVQNLRVSELKWLSTYGHILKVNKLGHTEWLLAIHFHVEFMNKFLNVLEVIIQIEW